LAGGVGAFNRWEANIRNAASQYQKANETAFCAQETERAAFRSVNRDLEVGTEGPARVRAIGRNHALWSLLVKDLAQADNRMPAGIKDGLIGLGLWSMRYSTQALLQNLPVAPLIEVNDNVLAGLLAQAVSQAAGPTGPVVA
jgi:flagellar protein FlaF